MVTQLAVSVLVVVAVARVPQVVTELLVFLVLADLVSRASLTLSHEAVVVAQTARLALAALVALVVVAQETAQAQARMAQQTLEAAVVQELQTEALVAQVLS